MAEAANAIILRGQVGPAGGEASEQGNAKRLEERSGCGAKPLGPRRRSPRSVKPQRAPPARADTLPGRSSNRRGKLYRDRLREGVWHSGCCGPAQPSSGPIPPLRR